MCLYVCVCVHACVCMCVSVCVCRVLLHRVSMYIRTSLNSHSFLKNNKTRQEFF